MPGAESHRLPVSSPSDLDQCTTLSTIATILNRLPLTLPSPRLRRSYGGQATRGEGKYGEHFIATQIWMGFMMERPPSTRSSWPVM